MAVPGACVQPREGRTGGGKGLKVREKGGRHNPKGGTNNKGGKHNPRDGTRLKGLVPTTTGCNRQQNWGYNQHSQPQEYQQHPQGAQKPPTHTLGPVQPAQQPQGYTQGQGKGGCGRGMGKGKGKGHGEGRGTGTSTQTNPPATTGGEGRVPDTNTATSSNAPQQ